LRAFEDFGAVKTGGCSKLSCASTAQQARIAAANANLKRTS
jgi:hypothetical protein